MEEDRSTPVVLVLVGILFVVYSFKYRIGTIMSPGVSFFPLVCAGALTAVASLLLWKNFRSPRRGGQMPVPLSIRTGKVRQIFAVLLAFAVLHGLLGFWASIFGVMVLLQRIAGVSTWRWSVFGGGAAVLTGYLIFEYWMSAFFPPGVFGSLVFHSLE